MRRASLKYIYILVILNVLNAFEVTICKDGKNPSYKKLKGKELLVVLGQFPSTIHFTLDASGNITGYYGYLYHQLLWLSHKLEFSYKIFRAKENTNGIKRNGTWNGIIGTLLRGEADLGLVPMAISLERYEAIEFCGYIGGDWTSLIVRYPSESVSFSAALDIFSIHVWIGFLVSGSFIICVFSIIQYLARRFIIKLTKKDLMNAQDTMMYIWSTIISQGSHFPCKNGSLKLLAATWGLTAFVFVNIYNSTLASFMSVTYRQPEINSFKDLASSTTMYKAAVAIGSIQELNLLSGTSGSFKAIGDKVRKCSDCRDWTTEALVVKVLEKKNFVAVLPTSVGKLYMQKFSSERGICRLTMANERAAFQNMFLSVPKTSPFIEEINRESLWFHAAGISNFWFLLREKYPKQCILRYNNNGQSISRASRRLKLEQFYLPFLILFGGNVLAFLQFLREKLPKFRDGHYQ